MNETIGVWDTINQQGPLFAFMGIVIVAAGVYIKKTLDDAAAREAEREKWLRELVENQTDRAERQLEAMQGVIARNTAVFERVERKLDGK